MKAKRRRVADEPPSEEGDDAADDRVLVVRECVYFSAPVEAKYTLKLLKSLDEASDFALKNCTWPSAARVYLYINSEGGCAFAGLSMMDHVRLNRVPIVTIADGYVASAATFILLGGYERKSMCNAKILIHQLSTAFWGKYADLLDEAQNSKELMDTFCKLYAENTRLSRQKLHSLLKQELHMNAAASLEWGIDLVNRGPSHARTPQSDREAGQRGGNPDARGDRVPHPRSSQQRGPGQGDADAWIPQRKSNRRERGVQQGVRHPFDERAVVGRVRHLQHVQGGREHRPAKVQRERHRRHGARPSGLRHVAG